MLQYELTQHLKESDWLDVYRFECQFINLSFRVKSSFECECCGRERWR